MSRETIATEVLKTLLFSPVYQEQFRDDVNNDKITIEDFADGLAADTVIITDALIKKLDA